MKPLPSAPLRDRPLVAEALEQCAGLARLAVDPALLELCEQRIATLLGAGEASRVPQTQLELAAIAFTEQWVVDVSAITDELVTELADQLGNQDRLMDFIHALLVVEQRLRLGIAWRLLA